MGLFRIFDLHVLVVAVLALGATWLCLTQGIDADLPFELIAIAVVFPTAFAIGAAHRRREEALDALATIRAGLASIHWAHRDWPANGAQLGPQSRALCVRVYDAVCRALACRASDRATMCVDASSAFSELAVSIEKLKAHGVSGSEVSRANQFLNQAVRAFERLRSIADYRTSDSLRSFCKLFLNVLPVLFAPFYAHIANEADNAWIGYGVALGFSLVLVGLDNVQDGLENPFDGLGVDDVKLDDEADLFWLR